MSVGKPSWISRISSVLPFALPVMAGYVAIGIPCGILEAEVGIAPWMALLLSATFYTGAGQFMLANLWLAGQGPFAIAASISFINLRQLLYSAAFAPRFQKVKRGLAALFALTVTDESFGVNMDRFAQAKDAPSEPARQWDAKDATCLNILCMSAWALANFVGACVGDALAIPTAVASFAMTAIFICLLFGRDFTPTTVLVAVVSVAGVVLCKSLGWDQPAIIVGALLGVGAGTLFDVWKRDDKPLPHTSARTETRVETDEGRYGESVLNEEALAKSERAIEGEQRAESEHMIRRKQKIDFEQKPNPVREEMKRP